jgi:hypothetical protein
MLGKVFGPLRSRMAGEIGGGTNKRGREVWADAHGNHVFRHWVTQAHADVISLLDDASYLLHSE